MPSTPLNSYLVEIVDTNGMLVPTPTITVRDVGTLNAATIYSDEAALKGTTTNPQTVNPFRFFAEAGTVDLLVVKDAYQYRPRNITPHIHGQHILVIELENVAPGSFTVGGNLVVSGAGPHAIGGATLSAARLALRGNFTGTSPVALYFDGAITGAVVAGQVLRIVDIVNATITVPASAGAQISAAGLRVGPPALSIGAGSSVPDAATVLITGAPAGATNNYALWVDAGSARLDGLLVFSDNAGNFVNLQQTAVNRLVYSDAVAERFRVDAGILALGTAVTTGATAGEMNIANSRYYRNLDAAGTTSRATIGRDASDRTEIYAGADQIVAEFASAPADTETSLFLLRDLGGTETMQRVTQGAVDSGGAGFRVLRVPN